MIKKILMLILFYFFTFSCNYKTNETIAFDIDFSIDQKFKIKYQDKYTEKFDGVVMVRYTKRAEIDVIVRRNEKDTLSFEITLDEIPCDTCSYDKEYLEDAIGYVYIDNKGDIIKQIVKNEENYNLSLYLFKLFTFLMPPYKQEFNVNSPSITKGKIPSFADSINVINKTEIFEENSDWILIFATKNEDTDTVDISYKTTYKIDKKTILVKEINYEVNARTSKSETFIKEAYIFDW